jgi:hypothetical protein
VLRNAAFRSTDTRFLRVSSGRNRTFPVFGCKLLEALRLPQAICDTGRQAIGEIEPKSPPYARSTFRRTIRSISTAFSRAPVNQESFRARRDSRSKGRNLDGEVLEAGRELGETEIRPSEQSTAKSRHTVGLTGTTLPMVAARYTTGALIVRFLGKKLGLFDNQPPSDHRLLVQQDSTTHQ